MTLRIVSELPQDLLPAIFICQDCHIKIEVSEYSDMTHKSLFSGSDAEESDEIMVTCPSCRAYALPKSNQKAALIAAYELWKITDPQSHRTSWSKTFHCPECKLASTIKIQDVKVINTAVAYAGETWDPVVRIVCPICKTTIDAGDKIPRGIHDTVLEEANRNRRR